MVNNKVVLTLKDCFLEGESQVKKSWDLACKINDKFNMFSQIYDDVKTTKKKGKLQNIPFVIKDNYDFINNISNSSSATIKNHYSAQNALVVEKILEQGGVPIAKSNCDEFGMGGTGLSSYTGPVINPIDQNRLIHGSSSGSAAAVATGVVPFGLATDTGDSSRKPAAAVGIYGFKPTWGLISRRGVHSFSPAFDTIGFLTNNIEDITVLMNITAGFDPLDFTSADVKKVDYEKEFKKPLKKIRVGYFTENFEIFEKKYHRYFHLVEEGLKKEGIILEPIDFSKELIKVLYPTYQAITFADITSELAKITGISFGERINHDDYIKNVRTLRTSNFGKIVKQRISIGGYIISKENYETVYLQAKKIRRLFINRINQIFQDYDLVFNLGTKIPTKNDTKIDLDNTSLNLDDLLQIANMGGNPSLVVPSHFKIDDNYFGFEVMGPIFKDALVLKFGAIVDKILKEGVKNEL